MCILKDRLKINEVSIQLKKLETALVKKKKGNPKKIGKILIRAGNDGVESKHTRERINKNKILDLRKD